MNGINWDFSVEDVELTKIIDNKIQNFFDHFNHLKRSLKNKKVEVDLIDINFEELINDKKNKIKELLLDNFNIPQVICEIMELINATFSFSEKKENILLIEKAYQTIQDVFTVFNLNYEKQKILQQNNLSKQLFKLEKR